MTGTIFQRELHVSLQGSLLDFLNRQGAFLTAQTANSPRAAGDAIETIIKANLGTMLGDMATSYHSEFARRSMEDIAFTDQNQFYYAIDIKTHRTDTKFNMPNLTSVERLSRFYEANTHVFVILMIKYHLNDLKVEFTQVDFAPIEYFDWDCLTIGALGWGQIQIANANTIIIREQSRQEWMLELCERLLAFYPNEIQKIQKRMTYFHKIKTT
jgi:hypothetical protein